MIPKLVENLKKKTQELGYYQDSVGDGESDENSILILTRQSPYELYLTRLDIDGCKTWYLYATIKIKLVKEKEKKKYLINIFRENMPFLGQILAC